MVILNSYMGFLNYNFDIHFYLIQFVRLYLYYGDELFFIGGKIGLGSNENDYKSEIYNFSFKNMKFNNCEICFSEKLNFIENQFHYCNDDSVGNFICLNDGCLATISISSLIK